MAALLEVADLHSGYGAIEVLNGISLVVNPGEIVTVIGANGAGKTTTLMTISGCVSTRSGAIRFQGDDLTAVPAHEIVRRGLAQSPEGRKIFPRLTVLENLEMGAFTRTDRPGIREDIDKAFHHFPILKQRQKQLGGTLSGGEQQMLAIGRALMSNPRLLLLDEPSLGLAPLVVHTIFEAIDEIKSKGTTILLVEQNAHAALGHSDRAYVLETGRIVMEGASKDLANDPRIKEAYLGE